VSDFKDAMNDMKETARYREQMNIARDQNIMKQSEIKSKMEIEKERLRTQQSIANTNLEIARENKNKYDVKANKEENNKKKNK
jgi:hypothetical protein